MNECFSLLIPDKKRQTEQPHFSLFLDYCTFAEKEKEKYQLGRTKLLYKKNHSDVHKEFIADFGT
jgi:hypothetical protein